MAQIDERARELNQPEPEPEDDVEPESDEDQDDDDIEDQDEDEGDEDGGDDQDEGPAPSPRPGQNSGAALSGGVVLGFLLYSAVIQVVRGGKGQLSGWLKAKLINEPYQAPKGATS
jgi:hypothetical protein